MSIDEQDALVGKLIRERKEKERELGAVDSKARRIGEILSSLGDALTRNPSGVVFAGQSYVVGMHVEINLRDSDVPKVDDIKDICARIRELQIEIDKIKDQLGRMGL